jgi:hypothetical protein
MNNLIQKLFFALGGFARWIYAMLMNLLFAKNHQKHIGYYLFEEEDSDNSGMDSNKKNFVLGIFMFIIIITLIKFID